MLLPPRPVQFVVQSHFLLAQSAPYGRLFHSAGTEASRPTSGRVQGIAARPADPKIARHPVTQPVALLLVFLMAGRLAGRMAEIRRRPGRLRRPTWHSSHGQFRQFFRKQRNGHRK